jgi:two-component system, LytTR family, response regulator LytT
MTTLKIGIVEDEFIIAENLGRILETIGYQVATLASTYNEAIEMIEKEKPDLVFLDINLKGKKDGIDVAWKIREDYHLPFIFLSSFMDAETIEKAKLTEPQAFLVKPFNKDEIYACIETCIYKYSKQLVNTSTSVDENDFVIKDAILIKEGAFFHKIKFVDIIYFESEHIYTYLYTATQKIMVRSSMHKYIDNFIKHKICRIHRSFAINLEYILTIESKTITLTNGQKLPLGKTFRDQILTFMKAL